MDAGKIIIPLRILRPFVQAHPEWIFLYGQDHARKGCFGQAWFIAHEPNTYPISTMVKICNSSSDRFFEDNNFEFYQRMIDQSIAAIPRTKPIIPLPKIGEGYSEMKWKAPRLFEYLHKRLNEIKYPNIEIDYYGRVYPSS